jgi:hypothetical protein
MSEATSGTLSARNPDIAALIRAAVYGHYPQFHIGPIGVQFQHGPKLPPL